MTAMTVGESGEIASIHLRDLGDITFDTRELLCALSQFKLVGEIKAYLRMKIALRMRGALPTGMSSLARIAQVGPKAFERMGARPRLLFRPRRGWPLDRPQDRAGARHPLRDAAGRGGPGQEREDGGEREQGRPRHAGAKTGPGNARRRRDGRRVRGFGGERRSSKRG